uniref:Ig-like domain-containing protein n=1 Tax=Lepisosteus oculatus TaxID=7918 RepID=W5LX50_LEPOC
MTMKGTAAVIFLYVSLSCARSDVVLTQTDAQLKAPGDKITLSCTGSGYTFKDYGMHWVRQAPQKGLEWLAYNSYSSASHDEYADFIKERIKVTRDNSKSVAHLEISSLKTEDTAVYYCARRAQ